VGWNLKENCDQRDIHAIPTIRTSTSEEYGFHLDHWEESGWQNMVSKRHFVAY
jgi:hypothetical protein